jgi:hypothetical protein
LGDYSFQSGQNCEDYYLMLKIVDNFFTTGKPWGGVKWEVFSA